MRAGTSGFHLVATKVTPPFNRAELVPRPGLQRLLDDGRLVLLDAPAGWGKTTLVSEWVAAHGAGATAWLSLDREDDAPVRFWSYVIAAIQVVRPELGERSVELLHTQRLPPSSAALPELLNELGADGRPLVLVLDDYHLIADGRVHAGVIFLIEHLPANVRVFVTTRADPPFPIAHWRVRGELTEIRAEDLRFALAEAGALLNGLLRLDLGDASLASLHDRTEGWIAGLYLAALSLRRHPEPERFIAGFAGNDRHVVDYLGEEVLDALADDERSFLVRASVVDRMTGALCDEVTGCTGSAARLSQLERVNHFLVPLDNRHEWYRFHQLFGELLRLELQHLDPTDVSGLHRRAAAWLLDHDLVADGIRHTTLAGDTDGAAELLAAHWGALLQRGESNVVAGLLDALGTEAVRSDVRLCLIRAWMTINLGNVGALPAWIAAAELAVKDRGDDDATTFAAAAAMLRCIGEYLAGNARAAIAAAKTAVAMDAEEVAPWRSVGCPVLGISLYWSGAIEESTETLRAALPRAEAAGNHLAVMHALGCLALTEADRGDQSAAQNLAARAAEISVDRGFADHWAIAMTHLADGRTRLDRGDLAGAERSAVEAVERSRRGLANIELAYGLVQLADVRLRLGQRADASELLAEARGVLCHCRDPGVVTGLVDDMTVRLGRAAGSRLRRTSVSALSCRELVVLSMLPTELNLRDIAATLYVSINTVKSQTRTIYRKLDVTNRAEAVERSRQLGLA